MSKKKKKTLDELVSKELPHHRLGGWEPLVKRKRKKKVKEQEFPPQKLYRIVVDD